MWHPFSIRIDAGRISKVNGRWHFQIFPEKNWSSFITFWLKSGKPFSLKQSPQSTTWALGTFQNCHKLAMVFQLF